VSGRGGRRAGAAGPGILAVLLLGTTVIAGGGGGSRLLVMDLPYARVWEGVLRAFAGQPLERAGDGVVETGRVERAPRPDEPGIERVAERVTVRVEPVGSLVTRVSVEVQAEGLRGGRWEPLPDGEATARAVLAEIRAALG
jgi:hypothetical protein